MAIAKRKRNAMGVRVRFIIWVVTPGWMKQQQFGMDKGRARNLRSLCIIALEKKVEQAFQFLH
jgi:hypothetical protein